MALPTLRTGRLLLRGLTPADAPRVRELAGEREVAATTLTIPHPYEEGMAEAWIRGHAAAVPPRPDAARRTVLPRRRDRTNVPA